jgi:fucose permease
MSSGKLLWCVAEEGGASVALSSGVVHDKRNNMLARVAKAVAVPLFVVVLFVLALAWWMVEHAANPFLYSAG